MFFVPLWSQFVDDNIEIYLSLSAIALRSICRVYQVDGRCGRANFPVLDDAKRVKEIDEKHSWCKRVIAA
jgi:hypothetical protein